jgi:imidazoleglycerol-phosphate dehydratase
MTRVASISRTTKETSIECTLLIDGSGTGDISTGLPFYDHMLDQLARHGGFDLTLKAVGDLEVDGHHTVEDVAIVVGEAFREAVGDKRGVRRFASGLYPLDEALVEVSLDLSGRPFSAIDLRIDTALPLGTPAFNPEMAAHVFTSFAHAANLTLHITQKAGQNTHHIIEASFKGLARCLRDAVRIEGTSVPSTKGSL